MTEIILTAAGIVFAVLGYLLQRKDAQQEHQIQLLFQKHDDDAKALQELRVQIAESHYKKHELDDRFGKLEITVKEGLKDIGTKLDNITRALIDHVQRDDNK